LFGLEWYRHRMPYTRHQQTTGGQAVQITIEKTPGYWIGQEVPQRVHAMNESIKLLVIVRDPVDRAISDYTQIHEARVRRRKQHARFEDLVINPITGQVDITNRAIRRSVYSIDMSRWLSTFPTLNSSFHFVHGERLVADPVSELERVETFLGLQHRISRSQFYFNRTRGFYCIRATPTGRLEGVARHADGGGTEVVAPPTDRCLASSKGRTHPNISESILRKLRQFFRPYNEQFYQQTGINFNWPVT
jgi:[heparan sulfate]-glucosamine 3-sulfotransferase 5